MGFWRPWANSQTSSPKRIRFQNCVQMPLWNLQAEKKHDQLKAELKPTIFSIYI